LQQSVSGHIEIPQHVVQAW